MNNNDRINAYKHAFNFKPEKLSSEEVAKNNAAIESQQKPKTDAALAALLSSSYQEPEKDEEKPEFKPFSFDNAPVFKSIDQGDGADEHNQHKQPQDNGGAQDKAAQDKSEKEEPAEEDDFWHQRDAMLDKKIQNDALNLPSINPPPVKKEGQSEESEKSESDVQLGKATRTSSSSADENAAAAYKPVPYVPQEPVVPPKSFQEQMAQQPSEGNASDFRSSPEYQAFLRESGRTSESDGIKKSTSPVEETKHTSENTVNSQTSLNVNSPDYKPVPYVAPQQVSTPQQMPSEQKVQNPVQYQSQSQQYQQGNSQQQYIPQNQQMQPPYNQQPVHEKHKKRGFFEQLFGIKSESEQKQTPQQQYYGQQYTTAQGFQNQQNVSQTQVPDQQPYSQPVQPQNTSVHNVQNQYSTGIRAQAYVTEKYRDLQQPVVKRTAVETGRENPEPVREFAPLPEKNQFDFAAFAAKTGKSAFQPKKFEAQSLESMYKKNDAGQAGIIKTTESGYRPAAVQKLSKSSESGSNILYKIPSKDSACRRVAKFLLLIGVDEAAKVIALLPSDLIDKIIPEIASVRSVDPEEAEQIIAEFSELYEQAKEGGGVSTARTILEKAFGDARAQEMMQKAVPFDGGKPFEYLKDLDGEQMTTILKDESAPVRALVLSQVKPAVAAAVINQMDEEERKETIRRLAKLTTFPPDILGRIDHTMREKAQNLKMPKNNHIDGRGALANILRKMDAGAEKNILSNLSLVDTELETDLRKRLFTLDDVINADDRYLQKKLHSMSDVDIAVLICGKNPEFRNKILSNISKSRGALVLDEEEARKPIRKRDSEEMTNHFVASLRAAWESGDLVVGERDEEEWVE